MKNMDKRLTVPKWVLIVWPKIPPNAPEFICPICLPKPKSSGFQWKKALLGVRSPYFELNWKLAPYSLQKAIFQGSLFWLMRKSLHLPEKDRCALRGYNAHSFAKNKLQSFTGSLKLIKTFAILFKKSD